MLGRRTPRHLPATGHQSKAGRDRSADAGGPYGHGCSGGGAGDVPLKLPRAEVVVLAGRRLLGA